MQSNATTRTPSPTPGTAPLRAAIYVRVSSPGQAKPKGRAASTAARETETSLDTQLAECLAYAAERDWTVDDVHIYREVHVGYELWERPQLSALREAVRRRELDRIVVHTIDRFSRDPVHLGLLITEAEHDGVDIEFAREDIDNSPEGALIRFIKGYAGKLESERIKERVGRGKAARTAAGKLPAAKAPTYGYDWANVDKSAYVINQDQAAVVRRLFDLVLQGETLRSIALRLSAEGIPLPQGGRCWIPATIRKFLVTPAYAGKAFAHRYRKDPVTGFTTLRPEDEWVALPDGTIPPIVDLETFEAVAERLRRNKAEAPRHNQNPEATLLRAGYVRCGGCGASMVVKSRNQGTKHPSYFCSARVGSPCAARCDIAASILDAAVWARVVEIATHPELIAAKLANLAEHDPSADDLATIDRHLADVKRRQQNGTRALLDLDDESAALMKEQLAMLAERRRRLEEERVNVDARRRGWEEAQGRLADIEAWCAVAGRHLDDADYARKRQALIVFDVKVVVYKAGSTPRYVITADPMIDSSIVNTPTSGRLHNERGFRVALRWTDADRVTGA